MEKLTSKQKRKAFKIAVKLALKARGFKCSDFQELYEDVKKAYSDCLTEATAS